MNKTEFLLKINGLRIKNLEQWNTFLTGFNILLFIIFIWRCFVWMKKTRVTLGVWTLLKA